MHSTWPTPALRFGHNDPAIPRDDLRLLNPDYFARHDPSWFVEGRYFRVWAQNPHGTDKELHGKEFIILTSNNVGFQGVLVAMTPTEQVLSVDPNQGQIPFCEDFIDVAWRQYLEKYALSFSDGNDGLSMDLSAIYEGADNISIRLEALGKHTGKTLRQAARPIIRVARLHDIYSIAFATYKCQDLGCLDQASIRTLRIRYVQHLNKRWDLATDMPWTTIQRPATSRYFDRVFTPSLPMHTQVHHSNSVAIRHGDVADLYDLKEVQSASGGPGYGSSFSNGAPDCEWSESKSKSKIERERWDQSLAINFTAMQRID